MSIIQNKVIGNTLLLTINNASKRNIMANRLEMQKHVIGNVFIYLHVFKLYAQH